MLKNVQTTAQLHSTHKLAKYCQNSPSWLQEYTNWELPDVQTRFRKGRGTRDQIANICWIIQKARQFQKNIYFCFTDYTKAFSVVNEAEVDIYLEFSCFFYDQTDVGNLISGSSAFSKSSLNIWKFSVHVLSKPTLENFEHYFASVWNECNCVVCWTFFGIALLWDWNENWLLPCANFTSSVCM